MMTMVLVRSVSFTTILGLIVFAASMGFAQFSSVARAAPTAYLSYESSSWRGDTSCCRWLFDPWNNIDFRMPVQGTSAYRQAWISTTVANEGQKSLGAWLKHNPSVQEKQRIEFEISNGDYFTQHLEESRYYGVAVYIHPQSPDVLGRPVTFMQAWQSHDTTYPKIPPFALRFDADSAYYWSVVMAKDVPGEDNRSTHGTADVIYTSPAGLGKGVWHEFIVQFKPSVQGKGAVRVWRNGAQVVSQTNNRTFGYVPRSAAPVLNNFFAVRYGAYRTSVPDRLGDDIILMFDQGKYGNTYESVDP